MLQPSIAVRTCIKPSFPSNKSQKVKLHTTNRRKLEWIGKQLGIKEQADWYSITGTAVKTKGGNDVLAKYNGSLYEALQTVYPEFEWHAHLFVCVPQRHWKDGANQRKMLDWIGEQLNVERQEDWYKIRVSQVKELGGTGLLRHYYNGSLFHALQTVYREFDWKLELRSFDSNVDKLRQEHRKLMDRIADHLKIVKQEDWYAFTATSVLRIGAAQFIREFYDGSLYCSLQYLYPEFQWNPILFSSVPKSWKSEENIRMSLDSIGKTNDISNQEDWYSLLESKLNTVGGSTKWITKVLKKGYPEFHWSEVKSNAPPALLLAKVWNESIDPTGYWMSEKFDGSRALWTGSHFVSRLGQKWRVPKWFVENFPTQMTLDGELWGGVNTFKQTQSLVRKIRTDDTEWKRMVFKVFDAPSLGDKVFEERQQMLRDYFESHHVPYVHLVEHVKCTGVDHLKQQLEEVERRGGEGIMLRAPRSLYETTRSNTLLKIKSSAEAEAKVVAHQYQLQNKPQNTVRALICEMPNGKTFRLTRGITQVERMYPPPVGSVISYTYQTSNWGIPKFPVFKGVRNDVNWMQM